MELGGLRCGGLNGCWQYKPRGPFLYYQEEAEAFLADFPAVDIFISHNSPRRVHDREDEVHTGFNALNSYIGEPRRACSCTATGAGTGRRRSARRA